MQIQGCLVVWQPDVGGREGGGGCNYDVIIFWEFFWEFKGSNWLKTGSIWLQKQTPFILWQQREPVKCGRGRARVRAQILTFAHVTLN